MPIIPQAIGDRGCDLLSEVGAEQALGFSVVGDITGLRQHCRDGRIPQHRDILDPLAQVHDAERWRQIPIQAVREEKIPGVEAVAGLRPLRVVFQRAPRIGRALSGRVVAEHHGTVRPRRRAGVKMNAHKKVGVLRRRELRAQFQVLRLAHR